MKNIGLLGIVIIALGLSFSLGWSQSGKIETLFEGEINKIKKSVLIPQKIEILEFHSEILNFISNEEDKKYIEHYYLKGVNNYILKNNITIETKSKIYDIFVSADIDLSEEIDGCSVETPTEKFSKTIE